MICACVHEATRQRLKRIFLRKTQLELPFPPLPPTPEMLAQLALLKAPENSTLYQRQPCNFPPGWMAMADADPFGWREKHYARWSERRKAEGLPHVVLNPMPSRRLDAPPPRPLDWADQFSKKKPVRRAKITSSREGTRAGNAVPGQLCDPRRMKA